MKILSILTVCLLICQAITNDNHTSASVDLVRAAISEGASLKHDQSSREISDHYGDPTLFKQYIIRIPPVHA